MRPTFVGMPVALALLAASCSSSPVAADRAATSVDEMAVRADLAVVAKLEPPTVLCADGGCPYVPPSGYPSSSARLSKARQRLAADQLRLEAAQKKLATDEEQ